MKTLTEAQILRLQPRYKLSDGQLSITGFHIRKGISFYGIESVNLTNSNRDADTSAYSYRSAHTGYGAKKKALEEFTKWWNYVNSQPYNAVMTYPTKYKQGFTTEEVAELCLELKVNKEDFNKKFGINTCMTIDGNTIMYHADVLRTVRLVMENREMTTEEWD